jgi:predicted porin
LTGFPLVSSFRARAAAPGSGFFFPSLSTTESFAMQMKKSFITLAVLAATGTAAMAQSSVTVFGVVDVGVADYRYTNLKAPAVKSTLNITGMNNSGDMTSRLGFRGIEDLGGGLKATFWLEVPIEPDAGLAQGTGINSFNFGARSTVSLVSDGLGELRLGRDTSRAYENIALYDVFMQAGVGESFTFGTAGSPLRYSNMIAYFTPKLSGFSAALDFAPGQRPNGTGDTNGDNYIPRGGNYWAGMLGYAGGPLSVTFAAEQMKGPIANGVTSAVAGDPVCGLVSAGGAACAAGVNNLIFSKERSYALAASYDFGVAKLNTILRQQRNDFIDPARPQRKLNSVHLGTIIPIGPHVIKLAYNYYNHTTVDGKANQFAAGYVYNFSKRTLFYGTYAYLKNTGNEAFGVSSKGLAPQAVNARAGSTENALTFGIRHTF